MNSVLRVGQAGHPNHHHVGIVVEAGVLRLGMDALIEVGENAREAGKASAVLVVRHNGRHDVATGAPNVRRRASDVRRPCPRAVVTPVANGKVKPASS